MKKSSFMLAQMNPETHRETRVKQVAYEFELSGIKLMVHKVAWDWLYGIQWGVSEPKTGRKFIPTNHKTRKECVEETKKFIEKVGLDEIKRVINKFIPKEF